MLELYVNDEANVIDESIERLVSELLAHAATEEKILSEAEVSLTFMTDEEIQAMNAEYRGVDSPTDVISFPLEEVVEGEPIVPEIEGVPIVLGDIIISIDTAKRQAEDYGHDLKREVGFLALHGFLHLLGYDHMNKEEEKRMFTRQKEILDSFGLER